MVYPGNSIGNIMKIPFLRINIKLKNPVKFIWLKAIKGPGIDFRVPGLKRSSQVNIIGFEAEWTIYTNSEEACYK